MPVREEDTGIVKKYLIPLMRLESKTGRCSNHSELLENVSKSLEGLDIPNFMTYNKEEIREIFEKMSHTDLVEASLMLYADAHMWKSHCLKFLQANKIIN